MACHLAKNRTGHFPNESRMQKCRWLVTQNLFERPCCSCQNTYEENASGFSSIYSFRPCHTEISLSAAITLLLGGSPEDTRSLLLMWFSYQNCRRTGQNKWKIRQIWRLVIRLYNISFMVRTGSLSLWLAAVLLAAGNYVTHWITPLLPTRASARLDSTTDRYGFRHRRSRPRPRGSAACKAWEVVVPYGPM